MILSPAKTLDLSPMKESPTTNTIPDCNAEKTKEIMQVMKKRTQGELGKLLGLSAALTQTAHEVSCLYVDPLCRKYNLTNPPLLIVLE